MIFLAACSTTTGPEWQSPLARNHPLVGRVWDTQAEAFTRSASALAAAAAATYVLVGERHDNSDHHRLQARVVAAMATAGRRPAVVFEMIDEDRQPALDAFLAQSPGNSNGIGAAVDWALSGWPDWSTYEPIAAAALAANMPLRAGNLPKSQLPDVARQGLSVLPADRRARLGLDQPLSADVEAAMREEMFEAHCRMMPREAMDGLIAVQRARDALMADNMVAAGGDGAVLIAGTGHVRGDRGVPGVLRRLDPSAGIVTIAFVEVRDGRRHPQDYAETYGEKLPFDFLWFTPRGDDVDHCAELEKQMNARKPKQ
jgi:uncharacterized iron-regulated protein